MRYPATVIRWGILHAKVKKNKHLSRKELTDVRCIKHSLSLSIILINRHLAVTSKWRTSLCENIRGLPGCSNVRQVLHMIQVLPAKRTLIECWKDRTTSAVNRSTVFYIYSLCGHKNSEVLWIAFQLCGNTIFGNNMRSSPDGFDVIWLLKPPLKVKLC